MELARVIGTVVSTIKDESLVGFKLLVVQPVDHEDRPTSDAIVALDPLQAGPGDLVAWIGGREAALVIPHELCPVDAAIVQIVDQVDARDVAPGSLAPWVKGAQS